MPIIEALCAGVPVVTSGGSSLTEAGGEAVVYVNYTDEQAIARAVKAIIVLRQKERSKIVMRGKKQALRFGENILAWSMMAMYQKVMDK